MFKNPLSLWLKRTFINRKLEKKFKDKSLKIGYMSIVQNCKFGQYNTIGDNVSITNVEVNDMTYITSGTSIKNAVIGKFCSIGQNCLIGLGKHPSSTFVSTHPVFFSPLKQTQISFTEKSEFKEFEKITIGNDVWIGANVTILDGIRISDGAIIAAGSLVAKNIPPYAIVGGVPSKIIKYRFTSEEIKFLLLYKWWDKNLKWLEKEQAKFLDIEEFIKIKRTN